MTNKGNTINLDYGNTYRERFYKYKVLYFGDYSTIENICRSIIFEITWAPLMTRDIKFSNTMN